MQISRVRVAALAVVAGAALSVALMPAAQSQSPSLSQLRANPSYQPVGVSASGSGSTAWFHDPSTGRAIACQTTTSAQAGLSGMQCVAAKLPQEGS